MSKWLGVIIKGREQLKDEAHSGCSVIHHNDIVEIKKMRHYVNNDKGVTVRKLHKNETSLYMEINTKNARKSKEKKLFS